MTPAQHSRKEPAMDEDIKLPEPFGYVSDFKHAGIRIMSFQHAPYDQTHSLYHSTREVYTADQLRAIEQAATAPLLARIAELEAELEKTKAIFAASCNHAAVMEMDRDARRYRWLRETSYLWPSGYAIYSDEQVESVALWHKKAMTTADIDAAIDAAMKEQGHV